MPHHPILIIVGFLKVRKSLVDGGGEGLYAVRDIEKDEIVAFYNGVGLRCF